MDFKEARENIKPRLRDYVESITVRHGGHNTYNCPICGSGTGSNHTAAFNINSKDTTKWKCFGSCNGKGGDIFDLIGEVEGITDKLEQLKRAAEIFGVDLTTTSTPEEDFKEVAQNQPKTKQNADMNIHTYTYTQENKQEEPDYTDFFIQANKDIDKTNYHRGLSIETLNRFKVGYVENWRNPKAPKMQPSPRLIIPTSKHSYLARYAGAGDYINYQGAIENKSKAGKVHILNAEALTTATKPVFVVEGEIDALSIIEAGGEAVAMGSTAYKRQLIQAIEENKPLQPLILALDNDAAGEKATAEIEKELDKLGVIYYRYNPAAQYKDANEALLADREAFIKAVARAEDIEAEALEAEREEYFKTRTSNHIQDFINGIAASVNTPATATGFDELDNLLEGGLYEGLYIIGAITSLGKTTLALQIADQIAEGGQDVLIFSLEMARAELMSKSISRLTLLDVMANGGNTAHAKTNRGITTGSRYPKYCKEEKEIINRSIEAYSKYAEHIYIHEGIGDIGTEQIKEIVAKHKRFTGQTPVILVDYMQILAPYDVRATDKQNTDKGVLELKRLSREYKTPVIAISSFNRDNYKNEVDLTAFKESGAIEYGSDVLIGLQFKGAGDKSFNSKEAKKKNPREVELVILKNRNGRTGDKIDLKYYPMFNYFYECEA